MIKLESYRKAAEQQGAQLVSIQILFASSNPPKVLFGGHVDYLGRCMTGVGLKKHIKLRSYFQLSGASKNERLVGNETELELRAAFLGTTLLGAITFFLMRLMLWLLQKTLLQQRSSLREIQPKTVFGVEA